MLPRNPPHPLGPRVDEGAGTRRLGGRRRRLGEFEDHAEWFFGSGDLPRWAGYTLGFDIVSGYLRRHPALTAADLVTTDAETILRGSGFHT